MKKLRIVTAFFALALCFCACEKDSLGIYNPKVKIQKIYSEGENRFLKEKWFWQGDQLAKIDYYRRSDVLDYTQTYIYDGKRLSRIEMGGQYTEFLYDGNKLTTINTYDGDRLLETYILSYDKNKLSHMDIVVNGQSRNRAFLLNCLIPRDPENFLVSEDGSESKRERYDFKDASVDFIWEGDNIVYMKMRLTRPDSIQRLTFSYVYDEGVNPKNGFFTLNFDHQFLNDQPLYSVSSKNNAIAVMVTNEYDVFSKSTSYTYSYDYYSKKYPSKIYSTFVNNEHKPDSLLLYTYQYQ